MKQLQSPLSRPERETVWLVSLVSLAGHCETTGLFHKAKQAARPGSDIGHYSLSPAVTLSTPHYSHSRAQLTGPASLQLPGSCSSPLTRPAPRARTSIRSPASSTGRRGLETVWSEVLVITTLQSGSPGPALSGLLRVSRVSLTPGRAHLLNLIILKI